MSVLAGIQFFFLADTYFCNDHGDLLIVNSTTPSVAIHDVKTTCNYHFLPVNINTCVFIMSVIILLFIGYLEGRNTVKQDMQEYPVVI